MRGSVIAEPVERSAENGMDVFGLRDRVISDYSDYVRSFIRIKDEAIHAYVDEQLGQGRLWPDPLVQLNPSFEPGATVEELAARGVLADECRRIFRRGKNTARRTRRSG